MKTIISPLSFVRLEKGSRWAYKLTQRFFAKPVEKPPAAFCNDWLSIGVEHDGQAYVLIKAGYACDGCTAVPDVAGALAASFPHDAIYQYAEDIAKAWGCSTWKVLRYADGVFLDVMRAGGCPVALLYYIGVSVLGWPFHKLARLFRKHN